MQSKPNKTILKNSIHIRLTDAIETNLQHLAAAHGQKTSAYARFLLVKSIQDNSNNPAVSLPIWMR